MSNVFIKYKSGHIAIYDDVTYVCEDYYYGYPPTLYLYSKNFRGHEKRIDLTKIETYEVL